MNGSEELLMPSAEYVMAFKWIIDGILLPAVGAVGIIGIECSMLVSVFILAILCRPRLGKSNTPVTNMLRETPF